MDAVRFPSVCVCVFFFVASVNQTTTSIVVWDVFMGYTHSIVQKPLPKKDSKIKPLFRKYSKQPWSNGSASRKRAAKKKANDKSYKFLCHMIDMMMSHHPGYCARKTK